MKLLLDSRVRLIGAPLVVVAKKLLAADVRQRSHRMNRAGGRIRTDSGRTLAAIALLLLLPPLGHAVGATIRYNHSYDCNGEPVQVAHCMRDSDQPGVPATPDAQNFCQLYYPGRPNKYGTAKFPVELYGDVILKLRACGALKGDEAATKPQATATAASPTIAAPAKSELTVRAQAGRNPAAAAAHNAGTAFMVQRKYTQAVTSFREALQLQPDYDEASNHLGTSLMELGKFEEAAQAYRDAVRMKPDSALYHYNLGLAYYRLERHAEAGKSVRESLARNPQDATVHALLGHVELALENYPAAVADYQEAARLTPAPGDGALYFYLGNAQMQMKDYEPAMENLRASLRLNANDADAMNVLGVGLFRTGRFELALEKFREASYRKPKEMTIHVNIGKTLLRLGHPEAAKRVQQALQAADAAMAKLLMDEINNPGAPSVAARKQAAAPRMPARPKSFGNPGIALEWLPPGSFAMGDRLHEDEFPEHRVEIATGFYIGKYEVTQSQWEAVMGANPSLNKSCGGNCPVDQVSWNDAQQFLAYLNQDDDGFRYRLPSEAEWEYAYRAGRAMPFYAQGDIGWSEENAGGKSHPIGGKPANAFELFDMAGNVSELCADIYQRSFHGAPTDGSAWLMEIGSTARVARGGTYRTKKSEMTSSSRRIASQDERSNYMGFRIVAARRGPPPKPPAGGSAADLRALADRHRAAKALPAAIDAYRKAIFIEPALAKAHRSLGAIYREQKEFQRAVVWLQEAVRLDAGDLESRRELGTAYYQLRRDGDAVVEYKQVLAKKPEDAELHTWVGAIEYNLKRFEDALASYRESVRIQPDLANGWYGLGMTQVALKKKAEAEAALARLEKLDAKLATELKLGISKMK